MRIDAPMRHMDLDPDAPVSDLPAEAIETILDRGSLHDWLLLVDEIEGDPYGPVARIVATVSSWGEHYGADRYFARVIERSREQLDRDARMRYATALRAWRQQAGLTLVEAASRAGTSASRLSDYETGKVAPTTTVLGRLETVLHRAMADGAR